MTAEATVDAAAVRAGIRALELPAFAVCVHSSLRSFGHLLRGADALLDAFLDEGCTVLVPTFSWEAFAVGPPPDARLRRNGTDHSYSPSPTSRTPFSTSSRAIDLDEMGRLPAAVLARDTAVRGDHPLCSFTAIGSHAAQLVAGQSWSDVYAPLRTLADLGGRVLLIGVDLTTMTLLHLAETDAGRVPFKRWAHASDGSTWAVPVGGCSDGFNRLAPEVSPCRRSTDVGASRWSAYDANCTLARAVNAIRSDPELTVCEDRCQRCLDARDGGPIT